MRIQNIFKKYFSLDHERLWVEQIIQKIFKSQGNFYCIFIKFYIMFLPSKYEGKLRAIISLHNENPL